MAASNLDIACDIEPTRIPFLRRELCRARLIARAWSNSIAHCDRRRLASQFARLSLESLAQSRTPGFALKPSAINPGSELDETARQLAALIGQQAAGLPVQEACNFISSLYSTLLPSDERSADGAFYTPHALTVRLMDLAEENGVNWATARILDPASGGGALLLEAAARMRKALKSSEPAFILAQLGTRLTGLELDPHAACLSQACLEIMLSDLSIESGRPIPTFIRTCDSLREEPREVYDLVIGNPPYGRIKLPAEQRERYARSLYGHANLYGLFTDLALRWTRSGGRIAYLTPASALGGQYYSALRQLLAKDAPPVAIDFVHARSGVFEDVLQETLLALYRKGSQRRRFQVHYLEVENEREARLTKNGKVRLPTNTSAPWLAPREPSQVELVTAAQKMEARLSDWGYAVSTGPLVWNRFKKQMRNRRAKGTHPLVWAEAVTADGRFVLRADKKNHAPHFKIERGDEWLVVDHGCVLLQRTTAKEQPRRLIAAELPESLVQINRGVVVENHLNMVRPVRPTKVSLAVIAAVLNSDIVDQIFRCISGSVAVSAFELESIPLPSASAVAPIEQLVARGANKAAVEKQLRRIYGFDA